MISGAIEKFPLPMRLHHKVCHGNISKAGGCCSEGADDDHRPNVRCSRRQGRAYISSQISFAERGYMQGLQFYSVAALAYEAARTKGLGRELPSEWFLLRYS